MNDENLKGHGFHERTAREQREIAKMGGRASGEARRKKANLREAANLLFTTKIDHPEWTGVLEGMGLESTLEYAAVASMMKEALNGNVSAYRVLMDTVGQTGKSESDLEEQQSKTELNQAKKQSITGENETDEALEKLDEILKGIYKYANEQETE